jgi:hypothetical protein
MVDQLTVWPREREGVPFDTEAFNRIINFLSGYLAAPFNLVQIGGNLALQWSPTADLFIFRASVQFGASVTLHNTIWIEGFKADGTTKVNLIRVTSGDIVELGSGGQRLSIGASLTNNTNLSGRNAANSASVTLIKLNTSDVIELGETAALLSIAAPLQNNTNLSGRNAANSASVTLIKLNTSDIIETGQTGTQHNLLGTVKAPAIDPPTTDGQVTELAVCKAMYYGSFSGGSLVTGDNYNVASATKNGVGDYTITWDRDFAAATYATVVTIDASTRLMWRVLNKAVGSLDIRVETTAGVNTDPDAFSVACFGHLS